MKKNNPVLLLLVWMSCCWIPQKAEAQLEVFLDFLIYDYGLLFGFEDEPGVYDIDFAEYPYELEDRGLYLYPEDAGRQSNVYFNLHFQSNEDNLNGAFFQFKYSPVSVLTLDLNHLHLFETLSDGEHISVSFTNFTAQYNRLRGARAHFWWGLGLTYAKEEGFDGEWGSSLGVGTTLYLKKPLSLYGDFKLNYFVEDLPFTPVSDVRLQVHLKRFLVYAGFQHIGGIYDWTTWSMGMGFYF
ncbi:MAG: hypothetical protein AAGD05_17655 [Bacteroidota bacterium]